MNFRPFVKSFNNSYRKKPENAWSGPTAISFNTFCRPCLERKQSHQLKLMSSNPNMCKWQKKELCEVRSRELYRYYYQHLGDAKGLIVELKELQQ